MSAYARPDLDALHRGLAMSPDACMFALALGVKLDTWQRRVLTSSSRQMLLNCSRQAGKSTVSAILALHRAMTKPKQLILLVSPSDRQSGELFRKVLDFLAKLPWRPTLLEENARSLKFDNGSRIVSLPSSGATIRGFSAVSLIVEDEAAFVDDELNTAIRPMLAVSGGQLVLMSTPNGRVGHFFEAWERGGDAWERIRVRGDQVSRIAPEFLAQERSALGELFRQEYECEFLAGLTGRVYSGYDESRNHIQALPPGEYRWLLGMDFGVVDECAFTVVGWRADDPTVYVAESYRLGDQTPSTAAEEYRRLEQRYAFSRVVGDLGGLGKAFGIEMRRRYAIPVDPAEKQNKLGFIELLNGALRDGLIQVIPSRCTHLTDEWLHLQWIETTTSRRPGGHEDHASDSMLYAWRAANAFLEAPPTPKPEEGSVEALREEQARMRADAERRFTKRKGLWR